MPCGDRVRRSLEIERLLRLGALCPVLMDVFALWRGEEFLKLETALPCEKDKRTPSCQLKFKYSFTVNFMGGVGGRGAGGSANARPESCQCAPLCATPGQRRVI